MNSITTTGHGPFNPSLKMSSLEIAELMEKNHRDVMRDIRDLIDQEAIDQRRSALISYVDSMNRNQPAYELDFQSTMVLITGYDAKRRALVIDRWMKLETGEASPLGMVGEMIAVNRQYFNTVLKNTNLLEENNNLLKQLLANEVDRKPQRKNFTDAEDREVLDLRAQGLSHRQIGRQLGRVPSSIRSCLRRLGVLGEGEN